MSGIAAGQRERHVRLSRCEQRFRHQHQRVAPALSERIFAAIALLRRYRSNAFLNIRVRGMRCPLPLFFNRLLALGK